MLVVSNELRDQNLMFIVYEAQGRDLGPIGTSCSVYFMLVKHEHNMSDRINCHFSRNYKASSGDQGDFGANN